MSKHKNIKEVTDLVKKNVFNDLGIQIEFKSICLDDLTKYHSLGRFDLAPSQMGPLAPMIESASVEVFVGLNLIGSVFIKYDYRYDHPCGGSNGYGLTKDLG